jgi:hypothetical protein
LSRNQIEVIRNYILLLKYPASTSAKTGYDFDPKNSYRKPPMTLTSHDLNILHW